MVNYQVMLQEQFDQMALILVDVCESYWPLYMCPVLGAGGHSVHTTAVLFTVKSCLAHYFGMKLWT